MKCDQDLCLNFWYDFKKLLWQDELNPRVCCAFGNVFYWTSVRSLVNLVAKLVTQKGKPLPLFEMFWFYMGIVQIALDPPALCQTGKRGKKVLQTILTSPYTSPPPPFGQCPYGTNTFQKGASLTHKRKLWYISKYFVQHVIQSEDEF